MNMKRTFLFFTALLITGLGCNSGYRNPEWKVGDWVSYEVESARYGARSIRYAITGTDIVEGETFYWLEMTVATSSSSIIYKMLVPYGYRAPAEKMIIKVGETPAVQMPKQGGLSDYPADENRPYVWLNDEVMAGRTVDSSVTVPAGEFRATHSVLQDIRLHIVGEMVGDDVVERILADTTDVEVWVNGKVPVLGIVAIKSPGEFMKLAASGADATTSITEEVTPAGMFNF